jgi:ADP-ribosylation factor GTPase-activating protein 1
MAVDPRAEEFFNEQMQDPENRICCDCGTEGAAWVSIPHGIYLSIGAAGLHRSLGVKVSFVQSTTMDSWKPEHLQMMKLGGNRRFTEFLEEQGIPMDMPIREKYSTRAAQWYRENLKALAQGLEPLAPLAPGTGQLPAETPTSAMHHVLDRVFSEVSQNASVTPIAVYQAEVYNEAPKAKGLCERLSDCLKNTFHSTTRMEEGEEGVESAHLCGASNDATPLPNLLESTLRPDSKGKLPGLGSYASASKAVSSC